jgi:hypothetical protein
MQSSGAETEIKRLVANIDHIKGKDENSTENYPPQQQDQQVHPHQLDSTVNDLVDQFGDTGVEEGEFPQAGKDDEYVPVAPIDESKKWYAAIERR